MWGQYDITTKSKTMKKVTQIAINAFNLNVGVFSYQNTKVISTNIGNGERETILYLHGNAIAKKITKDGVLQSLLITDAGWPTTVTKERLNAIDGASIYQKKGQWYLNGKKWNGEWVNLNKWNEEII